jgi:hypothetical protein
MKSIITFTFRATYWIFKWAFLLLVLLTVAFFAGGNVKKTLVS